MRQCKSAHVPINHLHAAKMLQQGTNSRSESLLLINRNSLFCQRIFFTYIYQIKDISNNGAAIWDFQQRML